MQNKRAHWLKKPILSGQYRPALSDDGSLTMRLKSEFTDFSVRPIAVSYARAFLDEMPALALSLRQTALIRNVLLMSNQRALVFAHSVLPLASLRGPWLGLRQLGCQPLGEALFANPQVKRTALSYQKLYAQHALYQQAVAALGAKPAYLWARRSVFSLHRANIMVTEVFLPPILRA